MLLDLSRDTGKGRTERLLQQAKKFDTIAPSKTATEKGFMNSLVEVEEQLKERFSTVSDTMHIVDSEEKFQHLLGLIEKAEIIAIDTETTGLDPKSDHVVGVSVDLNGKSFYLPFAHVNWGTLTPIKNQLTHEQGIEFMEAVKHKKTVWFNAIFDRRMIYNTFGVRVGGYFDCSVANKLLNENGRATLDYVHGRYCPKSKVNGASFKSVFKPQWFKYYPPKVAYMYACADAVMTRELYNFQIKFLDTNSPKCSEFGLERIAKVFWEIEMPLEDVVFDMEEVGLNIDWQLLNNIKSSYLDRRTGIERELQDILIEYEEQVKYYQSQGKLDRPVNFGSSHQMAILIYDVLKLRPKQNYENAKGNVVEDRRTGDEILAELESPFAKLMREWRGINKILSNYVLNIPDIVSADGKLHSRFNQVGTDTLRFSSNNINLQNIPSRNGIIRKMMVPDKDCVFISGDYSKQEIVVAAYYSEDQALIDALGSGLDIYSKVASESMGVPYEECLEFYPDGTLNKEGKKRRAQSKAVVLGMNYDKGVRATAIDLEITVEEAQKLFDSIATAYPNLRKAIDQTKEKALEQGYVETMVGTKRRLPELLQPEMVLKPSFNRSTPILSREYSKYENAFKALKRYKFDQQRGILEQLQKQAQQEGINLIDNRGKQAKSLRQCFNAVIQGTASYMTKLALLAMGTDKEMIELGAVPTIQVHDEVILQVPKQNAEKACERLEYLMIKSANDLGMEIKVDTEIMTRWNGELSAEEREEFNYV